MSPDQEPGSPDSQAADPLVGRVLSDRYRILRKVGEGGMGVVYLAEHAVIGKKVALKVLFPELTRRTDLVARFLQEARSASRISHENVIDISDFGQSPDGLVYIAMEYLDGEDLGRLIKTQGPLPWERARPILMQIAKALRAAHDHGVIHRDMKPENIYLIQREGHPDFVKVLDFGIAKVVSLDEDGPRLTQTGMIFGTPEYMSPEQAQGTTPDHRVDVYAVGCIMYHLLTGTVPFHADTFMGILTKHMMEPVMPPRQRRPDLEIPEEVQAVALKAMEKDRDKRWQDMNAFYRALGSAGGVVMEPSGPWPPRASLKYPELAPSNQTARGLRTEVMGGTPMTAVDEIESRPGRMAQPSGGKSRVLIGAVLALVVAGVVAGVAAFSSRSKTTTTTVEAPPPSAPSPANTAPPPSSEPQKENAAPTTTGSTAERAGGEAKAEGGVKAPAEKHARRRSSADAVKALGGLVDEGKPEGGKPARTRPSTPPELKDPFSNP